MKSDTGSVWQRWRPSEAEPWNVSRVVHLHRRAGFAATWDEIGRDLREGPDAAVSRLLRSRTSDETEHAEEKRNEFERMSSVIADAATSSDNINRLKAWWLYRMLFSPDPLGERLTLMWHNHFATSYVKVADVRLMRRQNETFRRFARAPFGEMLRRLAKDPAVLIWLDADANRKEHPNENLAREIMELFSLGVGSYTEQDIKEAARALTGWSVNRGEFRDYSKNHDDGEKTIFGNRGKWTGDDLVRMLLDHPATARRLAFRICELLMGEEFPSDDMLNKLADGLRERDLDVGWAVETVLRSEAFFSDGNIGNRVLGPVEFVVGATKSLEIAAPPPPSTLLLAEATASLGQDLFYPPNVFGWPGGRSWLTSRTLIGRANFVAALVGGELHAPTKPLDAAALAASHGFAAAGSIDSFYAELLLGSPQLPAELQQSAASPRQLVTTILASPEAQLG